MKKIHSFEKGFTLVELIVVIAIIAILASVSVVSYSRYIDNGRFSNDTQMARSMTTILENHLILNPQDELDAFDVRTIINEYSDEELDFETESKDSAFFYIENQNKIIVERFDDVEGNPDFLSVREQTKLLSDYELDAPVFSSPEEIFGEGTFLLSTSGSPEAVVVNFIANLLPYSSDVVADYNDLESYVLDGNNWFTTLLGFGISEERVGRIQDAFADFSPSTTLYVNNTSWTTDSDTTVNRILFARGISNIPTYTANSITIHGGEIDLPKTVRSIEESAFDGVGDVIVNLPVGVTVRVDSDAFESSSTITLSEGATTETLNQSSLTDYSRWFTFSIALDGKITYDVENLPIRSEITGYHIIPQGNVVTIKIYTTDGLVGYANNLYSITYFDDAGEIYFTTSTTNTEFVDPVIGNPGETGHWETSGEVTYAVDDDLPTDSRTLQFYWTEAS